MYRFLIGLKLPEFYSSQKSTIHIYSGIKQANGNDKISGRGLKIIGQRLKFDNYLVKVCET